MPRTDQTISRELRGPQLPPALFDLQESFFDTRVNLYAIQALEQEFFENVESLFRSYCDRQASLYL